MRDYENRNASLLVLGYSSYGEYLDSALWKSIRNRAMSEASGKCECCQGKATEVHHREYSIENLSGKSLNGLMPLCSTCHNLAEFDSDGTKTTLADANSRLYVLSESRIENPQKETQKTTRNGCKYGVITGRSTKKRRLSKQKMIRNSIPPELMRVANA